MTEVIYLRRVDGSIQRVETVPAADVVSAEVNEPSRFAVLEAEEFAGGGYEEPEYLIHELFPRRGLGLVWGESGAGKSFDVLDKACAVSRGVKWRDRPVTKARAVIVVAEGEHSFPLRLKAYAKHHSVPLSQLPAIIPAAPNLFSKGDVGELIAQLKERGADLVIIDTLSNCASGADENSARDMGQILANCKAVARELDALCVLIHHAGKNVDRGARGSSVLKPAMDVEIAIEGDGTTGTAKVSKLKDGPSGARFGFGLKFVELGISRKSGKPFGSLVVEHTEVAMQGPALSEAAESLFGIVRTHLADRGDASLLDLENHARKVAPIRNFKRSFDRSIKELAKRHLSIAEGRVSLRAPPTECTDEEWDK